MILFITIIVHGQANRETDGPVDAAKATQDAKVCMCQCCETSAWPCMYDMRTLLFL